MGEVKMDKREFVETLEAWLDMDNNTPDSCPFTHQYTIEDGGYVDLRPCAQCRDFMNVNPSSRLCPCFYYSEKGLSHTRKVMAPKLIKKWRKENDNDV